MMEREVTQPSRLSPAPAWRIPTGTGATPVDTRRTARRVAPLAIGTTRQSPTPRVTLPRGAAPHAATPVSTRGPLLGKAAEPHAKNRRAAPSLGREPQKARRAREGRGQVGAGTADKPVRQLGDTKPATPHPTHRYQLPLATAVTGLTTLSRAATRRGRTAPPRPEARPLPHTATTKHLRSRASRRWLLVTARPLPPFADALAARREAGHRPTTQAALSPRPDYAQAVEGRAEPLATDRKRDEW